VLGSVRPAPTGDSTPLPGTHGLVMDPATTTLDDGSVLMGGSPLRLLRLAPRAQALASKWDSGAPVGSRPSERRLARRFVSSGIFDPRPQGSSLGPDDVTVVIPVRDRPEELRRLLVALDGLACVVVDDASSDAARTEEIARDAKARFIGLPTNVGPSTARNAGLFEVATPLTAFVDSDCIPSEGWLQPLLAHFDDPLVAAVAPRIVPAPVVPPTTLSRYESVRSSLDRGATAGQVRPLSRIPYVPSAAIIVRTDVTTGPLFDPELRGGEDVDLVWRLVEGGWDVRYVPESTVAHEGPQSVRSWLARRTFYGTTAAPLSQRHPSSLAPLQTSVWSAAVWGLTLARRPFLASGTLAASVLVLARRLDGLVEDPLRVASRIAGGGTVKSTLPALSGLTRAWSPAFALGLLSRRTRRAAALALLTPALADWRADPGELDPARYAALHVADDLAYGSGVWLGCLRACTIRPLVPQVALRARVWSRRSLVSHLRGGQPGAGRRRGPR
jgi:mycofactocin glycosyltransferase